jgi:hypothetical protein
MSEYEQKYFSLLTRNFIKNKGTIWYSYRMTSKAPDPEINTEYIVKKPQ